MPRQIALLRAVNLGPRNRVPMPDLRAALEAAGYEDVRTLLASGNVVLTSDKEPDAVAREMERLIASEFGVDTEVIVRSRDELASAVERNPIAEADDQPKRCQVSFLSGEPDASAVERLEAVDVAPEPDPEPHGAVDDVPLEPRRHRSHRTAGALRHERTVSPSSARARMRRRASGRSRPDRA
jgi:uncharacterized protein (DUF1697 family)